MAGAPSLHRSRIKSGTTIVLTVMTALLAAGAAFAQGVPKPETRASRPAATGGEALFVEHCAMCHGASGMGTGLLARRIDVPLLEKRQGLGQRYVINAARSGIGNMPAITRGEVSDADLLAIAEYLSKGPHE